MARNVRMVIEYDGAPFYGFQRLRSGKITVQGEIERVLSLLLKEEVHIAAAGRTDRGVHAEGQVVSFLTVGKMPAGELARAVSAHLRPSIVVKLAEEAEPGFHARYSARSRVYQYLLRCSRTPSVLECRRVTPIRDALDLDAMRRAAPLFAGTHDFISFSSGESGKLNTVRTVRSIRIDSGSGGTSACYLGAFFEGPEIITVEIEADAFLRGMVRMIVGTLIEVGRGQISSDEVRSLFEKGCPGTGGPLAPPFGLCLVRVEY
jgi:tRNA pseudouridine38-40 synthase